MHIILEILGVAFIILIIRIIYENSKNKNEISMLGNSKNNMGQNVNPSLANNPNYQKAYSCYFKKEYGLAIEYFEKCLPLSSGHIRTMVSNCHYLTAQHMLENNGNNFGQDVMQEYQRGYNAIIVALFDSTDDSFERMQRYLLAGIFSGGLHYYNKDDDFTDTKKYLTIAARLGSEDAKRLLENL